MNNGANWCSAEYDELYVEQHQELNHARRVEIVRQMITLFHNEGTYVVLYHDAVTEAYRTDRFEGWLRQPRSTGPVLFSSSSPTYFNLKPLPGNGGDYVGDGLSGGLIAVLVAFAVAIVGAPIFFGLRSRSRDNRH
jgi:peptide/nickel transport system substrate-binding protein